jgi:hypothetical protein
MSCLCSPYITPLLPVDESFTANYFAPAVLACLSENGFGWQPETGGQGTRRAVPYGLPRDMLLMRRPLW